MNATRRLLPLLVLSGLALPSTGLAATTKPPANDDRADAQAVASLPATLNGTTVNATLEKDTEPGSCSPIGASVWYRFTAPADGRIVVDLKNAGDLDATVEAFTRVRSQSQSVACDVSDDKGRGGLDFKAKKGAEYLVRVGQLTNSVEGAFALNIFAPQPPAAAPGRLLPTNGADGKLDRLQNPDDAYSANLRAGVTYRLNFAGRGGSCAPGLRMYRPGTRSFEDSQPLDSASCNSYFTFTPGPGEGGRYSFLVSAKSTVRSSQGYHLQVGRAGTDDVTPGIFVRNYQRTRGKLEGGRLDNVDIYRFDVTRRSVVSLRLATAGDFEVKLLNDNGGRLGTGEGELHRGLRPGRYYAVVTAKGNSSATYTFTRISRTITRTRVTINGGGRGQSAPGRAFSVGLNTSPMVNGPGTVTIQRYDANEGSWNFVRRVRVRIRGGRASVSYRPPAVGRYRATGSFDGSRGASPSRGGYARVLVAGPLVQKR